MSTWFVCPLRVSILNSQLSQWELIFHFSRPASIIMKWISRACSARFGRGCFCVGSKLPFLEITKNFTSKSPPLQPDFRYFPGHFFIWAAACFIGVESSLSSNLSFCWKSQKDYNFSLCYLSSSAEPLPWLKGINNSSRLASAFRKGLSCLEV